MCAQGRVCPNLDAGSQKPLRCRTSDFCGGVVINKISVALLFLLIFQCLLSPPSAAQNADPCNVTTSWWFGDQVPLGWYNYSPYPGALVYVIAAHLASCPPPPQCPTCPPKPNAPTPPPPTTPVG